MLSYNKANIIYWSLRQLSLISSKCPIYNSYISRAASCPGPGSPCGWDYYYSGGENAHDLKGALVGGPNQQDQWNDDRTNYAVSSYPPVPNRVNNFNFRLMR